LVQTSAVLNDLLWSKSWDAVITDFCYAQQRKQPSFLWCIGAKSSGELEKYSTTIFCSANFSEL